MKKDTLIEQVSSILSALGSDMPWMTATGLSRKLESNYRRRVEPALIESKLEQYSQEPGRKIRYSFYPSRRTLDILWGHVDHVGEQKYLPPLERLNEPTDSNPSPVDEHAPWFFISHNYLDLNQVIELRKRLIANGYGVWIFETDIEKGVQIHKSVQEAISKCKYFISYVSARSIGSLWVQKEVEQALRGGVKEAYIFLDGEDPSLLSLFESWTKALPPDEHKIKKFCRMSAIDIGKEDNCRWLNRCEEFMHKLHEYLGSTGRVIAFPSPKDKENWQSSVLTLENLDEFLKQIRK
jgi:hypothetical protein